MSHKISESSHVPPIQQIFSMNFEKPITRETQFYRFLQSSHFPLKEKAPKGRSLSRLYASRCFC